MADDPEPSPEELAAKGRVLIEQGLAVTAQASDNARYIGFGLMIAYFAIRTSTSTLTERLSSDQPIMLGLVAFFGAVAVLFDHIQYWAGAASNEDARNRKTKDYDTSLFSYKLRERAYKWKQWIAFAGSLLLIVVFAYDAFGDPAVRAPLAS